ncbi:MAG TPA: GNAT family N-acetyltransferase [Mycobacteriales bacterium]|nr:GNAT family N-acetyltransferase [Mycobacteriales bacterium]
MFPDIAALELRRITAADWRALKHLRLAALLDEPIAYCERWSDAAALDDDAWRARAARGAEGGDSFQVMAWDGARPVATAIGVVEEHAALRTPVAWLVGVHVAPDLRGRGLLERLVDAVSDWARGEGAPALHLEVHEANGRAQAAYRRLGFTDTRRRRPYPLDPSAVELELARPL